MRTYEYNTNFNTYISHIKSIVVLKLRQKEVEK